MPDELQEFLKELLTAKPEDTQTVLETHVDRLTPDFFLFLRQLIHQFRSESRLEGAAKLTKFGIQAALVARFRLLAGAFYELSGRLAMEENRLEEAIEAFQNARQIAQDELDAGNHGAIVDYVSSTLILADCEATRGDISRAREVLSEARVKSHKLNSPWGELWTTANLAPMCLRQGEYEQALKYASLWPDLLKTLSTNRRDDAPSLPPLSHLCDVLVRLAYELYYEKDDYKNSSIAAKQALQLDPARESAYELLGFSQIRLKQLDEAIETWSRLVNLGYGKAFHQLNYSSALLMAGRLEEALVPAGEAIQLSPSSPRYYLHRAQILRRLDRHEEAINDFKQIIELSKTATDEPPPDKEPRSQADWERNMSPQDLAHLAMAGLIHSYRDLSRIDEARQTIKQLVDDENESVNVIGYHLLGQLEQSLGNTKEALAAYAKVVELRPEEMSAREERIEIYLSLGEVENALLDLGVLARKQNKPEEALSKLTAIHNEHPEFHKVLKYLGFAYLESFRPGKASETLTQAIEHFPDDGELYLWRGLAKIMIGGHLEPEWDDAFDFKRLTEAIEDLGDAVRLAPDNAQAVEAYKWLIDRVTVEPVLLELVLFEGGEPNGLFSILPEAKEPFLEYWSAVDLGSRRQWAEAIEKLKPVQTTLAQLGFPAVAVRIDMHLADNYLRLYDLQTALDHITRAERYHAVLVQPLSNNLREMAQQRSQRVWEQSFSEMANFELEYMGVYSIGFKTFMDLVKLLKADILSRMNDPRAVEALGDVDAFIGDVEKTLKSVSFRALTSVVMILRDDGQFDKAKEVLTKIEPFAKTDSDRLFLYNTAGTLYELLGELDQAMSYFQQAYDVAMNTEKAYLPVFSMNMASIMIHQNRSQEALDRLRSVDITKVARSEKDVYGYYVLMAQALTNLQRLDEAQRYILDALTIIEQARLKLRSFEARMYWQGEQENIYRYGVIIAAENNDRLTAFNLMERSRARAFVDQLAAGHLALPESKKHLQEIEQSLLIQQSLLNKLANTVEKQNPNFVDYELLAKLNSLNEGLKLFEEKEDDDKPARLSPEKIATELSRIDAALTRIDNEMEQARLLNATNTYGAVLTFPELREVLSN